MSPWERQPSWTVSFLKIWRKSYRRTCFPSRKWRMSFSSSSPPPHHRRKRQQPQPRPSGREYVAGISLSMNMVSLEQKNQKEVINSRSETCFHPFPGTKRERGFGEKSGALKLNSGTNVLSSAMTVSTTSFRPSSPFHSYSALA